MAESITPFALPSSRAEIGRIQRGRKKIAVARARAADWYRGKLDHIDIDKLDDPEHWRRIPILDKESLRVLDHGEFMRRFCIARENEIAEYWRSGGTTGKPVFYPRTFDDLAFGMESWARSFACMGIVAGDLCHLAFPLGVHPAGQVWARSGHKVGVGMIWAGAGNATPSAAQLDLIVTLKPTVFIGMSSFALHLANLAEARGIDLATSSVSKVVCSAETLSAAKREKIARQWGAEVYDVFGMSEAGLMGSENAAHDGIHIWTDLFFVEVIDPQTGAPVPEGEVGTFCVTPLWTNHATPFLRWNSGDLVRFVPRSRGAGRFADLFPMIQHANRTTGFFKVRGVNVNHAEFEDLMFRQPMLADFQAVLFSDPETSLESLKVRIEIRRGGDATALSADVVQAIRRIFEISASIETVEAGTLAAEFEKNVKAPRFLDQRI